MTDLDFEPQTKISNLTNVLERICVQTHSAIKLNRMDETKWLTFLAENEDKIGDVVLGPKYLTSDKNETAYQWTQNENYIEIRLEGVPKDEIEISATEISCSKIKGLWWRSISNITITELGDITQIEFDVPADEKPWPVLIRGHNADALSYFYLSTLCHLILGKGTDVNNEIFDFLLQRSAMKESHSGMMAYGLFLNSDPQRMTETVHWFARCAMMYGDHISAFCLANKLIAGEGIEQNGPVAEYMLCRLCSEGFQDAFCRLGILYLRGCPGVTPMRRKAHQLLLIAAYSFQDQEAQRLLEENNWDDLEKTEVEKEKEEEKQRIEEEKHKDDATVTDFLISASLLAGASALGYYLFKRFRK